MVGLARRGIAGRRRRGDPWLSLARALPRTARGRIGRPGGRQGDLPGGRRLWPGRRPGLSSRRPPVLACVCHPWCTSVRWGPGPGLPGLVLGERAACEVGAVAITEGDRTSGSAAPSFPRRSPNTRVRQRSGNGAALGTDRPVRRLGRQASAAGTWLLSVSFHPLADLEGRVHVELPVHALLPLPEVGRR